jgi:hypothetical protein
LDLLEEAEGVLEESKLIIHPEAEEDEEIKKSNKYIPPKTKQQSQIHAILEKEVYQKELQRLRKLHVLEEKKQEKEKAQRAKNFKIMNDMQNARALINVGRGVLRRRRKKWKLSILHGDQEIIRKMIFT